ncbi:hypothetical protein PCANC_08016 [Puccinia coronata f. sp. avenae]|uniref:Alpha/beta hydrolase fold-3 domain-containing protein n=1 Tax=Puccinia coronata f. sp. avenae TaxID=200324 RepID=A0A2N5SW98_9BASI|nr:hypothetical protein PCANC_08016 [Puccinia coronata f. sp. avenae]
MIDHLLGRPSPSWRRTQVILVLLFWAWRLRSGDPSGPAGVKQLNNRFKRFTPWQITVTLLTLLYGIRHWDTLVGLAAPEPLARLYSRGFYRATWINTALDAGFATAAPIPLKWLRDIFSVLFSGYYLIYANEADEKLRRYRAVPTVELLRITWEKTSNPIIQLFTRAHRPSIPIKRKYIFPRPSGSKYTKPITCWLYSSRSDLELVRTKNLILDVPGGGFIAMSPAHHEERILRWTIKTGIPILSIEYCKAPEYPFPYAIHECMDVYRTIQESKGRVIGMGRDVVDIVLTGDSAGANLSAAMIITILESSPDSPFHQLPLPVGIIWLYAALDFNFTSWMSPENLRILRRGKSSANLPDGILEAKSHLNHKSPLSVVDDRVKHHDGELTSRGMKRKFRKSIANLPGMVATWKRALTPSVERSLSDVELRISEIETTNEFDKNQDGSTELGEEMATSPPIVDNEKSLEERVLFHEEQFSRSEDSVEPEQRTLEIPESKEADLALPKARAQRKAFGTHLTMTSRTGFFNDRIISPSMMRCMAICYVGPRNAPDLTKDHHISPIFTPSSILARFPPVYLVCGEKDPFVDDTVIIAGKIREAKQQRKTEALLKLRKGNADPTLTPMKLDPILEEEEADWVQMRIFEGWSHGFGQMLSLLPEVSTALDLTADFILAAFQKRDARMPPANTFLKLPSSSSPVPAPKLQPKPSSESYDDEALTFTPRLRPRAESGSRSVSPSPRLLSHKPMRVASASGLGSGTSSSPTQRPLLPSLSISQGQSDLSKEISLKTPTYGQPQSSPEKVTPKALVDYNVASAAAIVTPPVLPTAPTAILSNRKEGNVLDDHHDLLHRRREEAGYGLPPMKTPEDHFKPLELNPSYAPAEGRLNEDVAQGQYVGEKDLLERRWMDATYGITHHPSESNPSGSVKSDG